jgi:hypothetical protein
MLVSIVSVLFIGSDSLLLFPVLFINFRTIDLFPVIHEHSDPLKHSRKRIQLCRMTSQCYLNLWCTDLYGRRKCGGMFKRPVTSLKHDICLNDVKNAIICNVEHTSCISQTTRLVLYRGIVLTPKKLIGSQLVKELPALYGTQRFITAFTIAHHLSLSWARCGEIIAYY